MFGTQRGCHRAYWVWAACLICAAGCSPTGYLIKPVPLQEELQETVVARDPGVFIPDKIAIVDVEGLLVNEQGSLLFGGGENPVALFQEKLDKAAEDGNVRALVLRVNSPGGTVAASDIMYQELLRFKGQTGKPVVACMLDLAASGAYYVSMGADRIVASRVSITGSIGVIFQTFSLQGTMAKIGMKAEAIKSGEVKDMGSPLRDLSEKDRAILQAMVMQFYDRFVDVVLSNRKNLTRERLMPVADGRIMPAEHALKAGLVDELGTMEDAIGIAKKMAGVERAKVVMYHRPLGYRANVYSSWSASGPTVNLVNINLPWGPRANAAQFWYLWQPTW